MQVSLQTGLERMFQKLWTKRSVQVAMLIFSACGIAAMFYAGSTSTAPALAALVSSNQKPPSPEAQAYLPFSAGSITSASAAESVSTVATDALAFYNSLNQSQQDSLLTTTYTASLARKWSNLPCGRTCRNGVQLGLNLTSAQYTASMQVIKDALGTATNEGSDEYHQMNLAEAYLHVNGGGNGYDSVLRWMAFLGTPSATGAWMLQFGGHHYAANIAFNNGHVIGATPFFMGLEPKTFTYSNKYYDPLGQERDSLRTLFASLSSTQLSSAYLSSSFSDCVMIPGETNGGTSTFPSASLGISLSSLTSAQQSVALRVIKLYVGDMDSVTANSVMVGYINSITSTYISYHGSGTSGDTSSFLKAQGDYMRISGPNVWIEFSCQGGVVIRNAIHYHTVWRDRSHDYGVDLTGNPIDTSSSTLPVNFVKVGAVAPGNRKAQVNWTVAQEINVDHYDIEHSANGIGFEKIASQNALAKNGGGYTYSSTTNVLNAGTHFFRIRSVDRDGKSQYSGVVNATITTSGGTMITVVPNPARGKINIQLPEAVQNTDLLIYGATSGKLVAKISGVSGSAFNYDVSGLAVGLYIVKTSGYKTVLTGKFTKQ